VVTKPEMKGCAIPPFYMGYEGSESVELTLKRENVVLAFNLSFSAVSH
jgi:hypothetical protein